MKNNINLYKILTNNNYNSIHILIYSILAYQFALEKINLFIYIILSIILINTTNILIKKYDSKNT